MHLYPSTRALPASALAVALTLTMSGVAHGDDDAAQAAAQPLTTVGYQLADGTLGTVVLDTAQSPATVPGDADSPIVVSVGDSYISGEAGRWAGNSDNYSWAEYSDAGGEDAYFDNVGKSENVPDCHRSKSAEIHIGHGVTSVNIACSGAETTTWIDQTPYKPGLDFASDTLAGGVHRQGQALMLQHLAAANPGRVKMVVMSIGGNDFRFGPTVQDCLLDYMIPVKTVYCSDDPAITGRFGPEQTEAHTNDIATAIAGIGQAMSEAGYLPTDWKLVIQNYPSPLPPGNIRYAEARWERQYYGGCGMYDKDLIWANNVALPTINNAIATAAARTGMTNIELLDLTDALVGRRLCEKNVNIVGPLHWYPIKGYVWSPVKRFTQRGASDLSEWVNQIRVTSFGGVLPPYQLAESLHPNYWGQLALRNCVLQAWNSGNVRGGTCVQAGTGLDASGWPRMTIDLFGSGDSAANGYMAGATGAPSAVRSLTARARSNGVARISWRAPKGGADRYQYRTREAGGSWSAWISSGASREVALSTLHTNRHYQAQVRAVNGAGVGPKRTDGFRVPK